MAADAIGPALRSGDDFAQCASFVKSGNYFVAGA
jgi:hypothetical protein